MLSQRLHRGPGSRVGVIFILAFVFTSARTSRYPSPSSFSQMAVTAFPSMEESPDFTLLNVSRLFTRLEHNLVSPGSELRTLRKSEFQRMRVRKVRPVPPSMRGLPTIEAR